MRPRLIVLGAGGHAKVAIETIIAAGKHEIVGLLDNDPSARSVLGFPVLGGDDRLDELMKAGVEHAFLAIGENGLRVSLGQLVRSKGFRLATAVSPLAHVSPSAAIGDGTLVVAGAVINAQTKIEDLVIVNTRASIDHDCHLGEGAHVAPGTSIAGQVRIGARAFIGIGSSVVPKISIGEAATVGAGSCVVHDIPPGTLAYGVPARPVPPKED